MFLYCVCQLATCVRVSCMYVAICVCVCTGKEERLWPVTKYLVRVHKWSGRTNYVEHKWSPQTIYVVISGPVKT